MTKNPIVIDTIKWVLRRSRSQSDLKVAAVRALGLMKHPDTVDTLIHALEDNDPLKVYIFDDEGEEDRNNARNVRKVAAEALMGTISAVSDLKNIRKICRGHW